MKEIVKKSLALILSVQMIVSMLPLNAITAFAEEAEEPLTEVVEVIDETTESEDNDEELVVPDSDEETEPADETVDEVADESEEEEYNAEEIEQEVPSEYTITIWYKDFDDAASGFISDITIPVDGEYTIAYALAENDIDIWAIQEDVKTELGVPLYYSVSLVDVDGNIYDYDTIVTGDLSLKFIFYDYSEIDAFLNNNFSVYSEVRGDERVVLSAKRDLTISLYTDKNESAVIYPTYNTYNFQYEFLSEDDLNNYASESEWFSEQYHSQNKLSACSVTASTESAAVAVAANGAEFNVTPLAEGEADIVLAITYLGDTVYNTVHVTVAASPELAIPERELVTEHMGVDGVYSLSFSETSWAVMDEESDYPGYVSPIVLNDISNVTVLYDGVEVVSYDESDFDFSLDRYYGNDWIDEEDYEFIHYYEFMASLTLNDDAPFDEIFTDYNANYDVVLSFKSGAEDFVIPEITIYSQSSEFEYEVQYEDSIEYLAIITKPDFTGKLDFKKLTVICGTELNLTLDVGDNLDLTPVYFVCGDHNPINVSFTNQAQIDAYIEAHPEFEGLMEDHRTCHLPFDVEKSENYGSVISDWNNVISNGKVSISLSKPEEEPCLKANITVKTALKSVSVPTYPFAVDFWDSKSEMFYDLTTEYMTSDPFQEQPINILITYANGCKIIDEVPASSVTGFTSKTPGTKTLKVKYTDSFLGKSMVGSFKVKVLERMPMSIDRIGDPVTAAGHTFYCDLFVGDSVNIKNCVLVLDEFGCPAYNQGIKLISSNSKVVKTDAKGNITAVGEGYAEITIKSTRKGVDVTSTFSVYTTQTNISKVSLKASSNTVTVSKASEESPYQTVKAVFTANKNEFVDECYMNECTFTSSNENVLKVVKNSSNPTMADLIPVAKGTATVSVKTINNKTAKVKITVKEAPTFTKLLLDTTFLEKGDLTEYVVGDELDLLGLLVYAVYNNGEKIEVPVSDCQVSSVNLNTVGMKTVTLKYKVGTVTKSASFKIKVYDQALARAERDYFMEYVPLGSTPSLKEHSLDVNLNGKGVTYTSSNTSVATVSASGVLTTKTTGTTRITIVSKAKNELGQYKACEFLIRVYDSGITGIYVKDSVTSEFVNNVTLFINADGTVTDECARVLYAEVAGPIFNFTDSFVSYTIDKPAYVSIEVVENSVKLTPVKVGTATLKCIANNGMVKTIKVTVKKATV